MNSVKFYLFKMKKFTVSWVAFMHHLILPRKEFLLGGIAGEGSVFNVQTEGFKNEKYFICHT